VCFVVGLIILITTNNNTFMRYVKTFFFFFFKSENSKLKCLHEIAGMSNHMVFFVCECKACAEVIEEESCTDRGVLRKDYCCWRGDIRLIA